MRALEVDVAPLAAERLLRPHAGAAQELRPARRRPRRARRRSRRSPPTSRTDRSRPACGSGFLTSAAGLSSIHFQRTPAASTWRSAPQRRGSACPPAGSSATPRSCRRAARRSARRRSVASAGFMLSFRNATVDGADVVLLQVRVVELAQRRVRPVQRPEPDSPQLLVERLARFTARPKARPLRPPAQRVAVPDRPQPVRPRGRSARAARSRRLHLRTRSVHSSRACSAAWSAIPLNAASTSLHRNRTGRICPGIRRPGIFPSR